MLRAAAGTGFWLALAWAGARLAGLLLARHPKLLTDLVAAALFATATVLVAQFVFEMPATGLIATSSVLIAVLGFALRNIFGDIFSGIALGIEHPYGLGDWIEATEGCSGRVTGISWRATRIVTRDGVTTVVPNTLIASHRIAVYGPDGNGRFRVALPVALDAAVPAARAKRILLAAALEAGRELPDFAPDVMLADLGQGVAHYLVRFHVPDFPQEMRWRDAVATAVQRALHRAGIAIAPPRQDVRVARATAAADGGRRALLDAVDLFRPFTPAEREALAVALVETTLPAGAAVVRRGEQGDSLYLLAEGVLDVRIARAQGGEVVADRLFPGALFGEMSLLTGQPRSATIVAVTDAVVLALRKAELDPVLRARPALLDGLTAIMADRQQRNAAAAAATPGAPAPAAPTREDLLARLKAFFSIR